MSTFLSMNLTGVSATIMSLIAWICTPLLSNGNLVKMRSTKLQQKEVDPEDAERNGKRESDKVSLHELWRLPGVRDIILCHLLLKFVRYSVIRVNCRFSKHCE